MLGTILYIYIYIYIHIQLDVHWRSQDSALLAVKEQNRPVGELLKYIYFFFLTIYRLEPC